MKIVIATGIIPPEIGGPAQYAKNLADIWRKQGYSVSVHVFSRFNFLPTGLRHFVYFCSILFDIAKSDFVLVLDTYSSALPATIVSKLFGKKIILRTGGDFLWEFYVERTGDLVLLREFYPSINSGQVKFSFKEKIIFKLTKIILNGIDAIIWSTEWQKDIFMEPYTLQNQKNFIVENYYGPRLPSYEPTKKNFIAFSRKLKWKHISMLRKVFGRGDISELGCVLDTTSAEHSQFLEILEHSYAVIIASLGDISPNTILDAIRCQKPFILTKETGLYPRIKDIGIFADPKDENDIAEKVLWLCDPKNYDAQKKKVESFSFIHTWEDIAKEYLDVYKKIK